jgi:TonB family protein
MFVAGLVLLAWSAVSLAAEPATRGEEFTVGADVDTRGHIVAVQVDKGVSAQIATVLGQAVKQWRFAPPIVDGKPVSVHTWIHVDLRAAPRAGSGYAVSVRYIWNGPREDKNSKRVSPRYPYDRIRARDQAFVVVAATVNPDGSITDPVARSRVEGWPLPESFAKSAEDAVRQWRALPERVDGKPVAGRVFWPLTYTQKPSEFSPSEIEALRAAARKRGDPHADDREVPLPPKLVVTGNSVLTTADTHMITFGGG